MKGADMQEVFEKIVDKLEELKKAEIEREDLCDEEGFGDGEEIYEDGKSQGRFEQVVRIIEIVKQEAEKYNNGWIPCSDRLPEEYTVLCCDKYGEMIIGHPYFDEVSDTNYSAESDNEMMYNCVAWQPLPEPYKK